MDENIIVDIARQAVWIIIKVSSPILIISLVIGLIISILQTVTSIQEQTLTFVPKWIGILLIIVLLGSWIMTEIRDFSMELFTNFTYYIGLL